MVPLVPVGVVEDMVVPVELPLSVEPVDVEEVGVVLVVPSVGSLVEVPLDDVVVEPDDPVDEVEPEPELDGLPPAAAEAIWLDVR